MESYYGRCRCGREGNWNGQTWDHVCQFDTYGPHDRAPRYELGCLPVLLIAFLLVWAFSDRSASESAEYVLSAVIAIPLYIVLKLFGVE